jgi:hypothetical protein
VPDGGDHRCAGAARSSNTIRRRCRRWPPTRSKTEPTPFKIFKFMKRIRPRRASVRGGQIHHVEAAPFVTIPYGLGNGWIPGSGR